MFGFLMAAAAVVAVPHNTKPISVEPCQAAFVTIMNSQDGADSATILGEALSAYDTAANFDPQHREMQREVCLVYFTGQADLAHALQRTY